MLHEIIDLVMHVIISAMCLVSFWRLRVRICAGSACFSVCTHTRCRRVSDRYDSQRRRLIAGLTCRAVLLIAAQGASLIHQEIVSQEHGGKYPET